MPLDPEDLKARARAQTGLDEFGDAPMEGLSILCHSLAEEARLAPEGVAFAEKLILSSLTERLKVEDHLTRHPEILDQQVAPILQMIGMPRSGNTALAQHLSEDPRARSILRWEVNDLIPSEEGPRTDSDPRIAKSRAAFEAAFKAMPWRQAILPNNFDDPAEHGVLLGHTFLNLHYPTLYRVPTYEAWLLKQDLTPAYAYLAKILKLLQAQRSAAFWNLKLPPDLFGLDAIEAVFPGTKYIWSHRNPVQSMSSVCSLCAALREKQGEAEIDKTEIGPEQLRFESEGVLRAMASRDRIGEERFFDVYQGDLASDLVGTIAQLYDGLGMEFTEAYRAQLTSRIEHKPRGRFGKHEHHLEDYNLTEAQVLERFQPYVDRFHVPMDR
jgi:hypothetical protein